MAQDPRKSELIAQIAEARQALATSLQGVRRGLDVPQRAEAAFLRHKVGWLTGASVLGFILAKLPARTKKIVVDRKGNPAAPAATVVRAGLFVTVLKLVFDLTRPFLTKWLTQQATEYARQRFAAPVKR